MAQGIGCIITLVIVLYVIYCIISVVTTGHLPPGF